MRSFESETSQTFQASDLTWKCIGAFGDAARRDEGHYFCALGKKLHTWNIRRVVSLVGHRDREFPALTRHACSAY